VANPGYFFQSFSGDVTSAESVFTFSLSRNTTVTAIFLPNGTIQDPNLVGYAGVQDDAGTPYIVTGGSLGESVTATTLEELKSYLASPEPLVVSFSGLVEGADDIQITSNKTLLGIGSDAHLKGIELEINGARNVIVRNVAVSHVVADGTSVANDAIVITGGSKHVWIDHCELFSDLQNGKDYYDGLLEIKNESSFVTVSWNIFRDHYKASLISSGDEQVKDTSIRATYHHNYFHACGSRLPSIRFGKAHIFNNYYKDNDFGSCVNSRMGAVVKVEHNYFEGSKDTIGSWDSTSPGFWEVNDNVFLGCEGAQPTESNGSLPIAYAYALDPVADVPALVLAGAGVVKE
jgi:pectate lyase